jgi:hypothetical protein
MTFKPFTQPRKVRPPPIKHNKGECPICLTFVCLERHHWFESDGCQWEVYICRDCNRILSSDSLIALGDHLLPPWNVQVEYVRKIRERSDESFPPLPPTLRQCKRDLALFRSWLDREHTEREIKALEMEEGEVVEMVKRRIGYLEQCIRLTGRKKQQQGI